MSYESWRASIPFSDEQIASALEEAASEKSEQFARSKDWLLRSADIVRKTGRLTSAALGKFKRKRRPNGDPI